MVEEKKQQPKNKENLAETKNTMETKNKVENKKLEEKKQNKKIEKETKKTETKSKKNEVVVKGKELRISTKHSVAICRYIQKKNLEEALNMLEEVLNFKKAIPMKGEIPHRKGKIMSGRYPIKAVKEFIKMLKQLKANAIVQDLEIEKFVIFCKADIASRPYRRFGRTRFKRTHVEIKLIKNNKNKGVIK